MVEDNKINKSLPCEYGYLSTFESHIYIDKKDENLTVKFSILSIGFGNGSVNVVYRSNQVDCKHQKNQCAGFKPLADSWYWEVY